MNIGQFASEFCKFDAVQQALDNSTHADEFMRELFRLGYVVIKL